MLRSNNSRKTYSMDIFMLKRQPLTEYHQTLLSYIGEYEHRENIADFESARDFLMKADEKIVEKKQIERIYNLIQPLTYMKHEEVPENKEILFYGFKHIKTVKIYDYMLIGCELDDFYENDKLFNFWSNIFFNEEIKKRNFKITGWLFITLVKRTNFIKIQSICL